MSQETVGKSGSRSGQNSRVAHQSIKSETLRPDLTQNLIAGGAAPMKSFRGFKVRLLAL